MPRQLTKVWGGLVNLMTGEWILTKFGQPNGGGVVVARSLWVSVLLYVLALSWSEGLKVLGPTRQLGFSFDATVAALSDTFTWFGVLFAAAFTSFYTRFSQQWTYLANLYNQIKATEVRAAGNQDAEEPLDQWKAGFIEDAVNLHLAAKPIFKSVIARWYQRPQVKTEIRHHTEVEAQIESLLRISETLKRRRSES